MRDVTIIGAGIGGLASALALAARGARVHVIEQAPALTEAGAGLQISPNGYRVLAALGLGPAIDAAGIATRTVVLADGARGREVVRMDLGGAPFRLLHRADLVAILAEAARARDVRISLGSRVLGVEDGARAQITLANGEMDTDFVVGADGIRSRVRPVLNGPAAATFTGQVAWRTIVPGGLAPEARVDMGPGRHLVRYPLAGDRVNMVGVEERAAWTAEGWHIPGNPDAFRAAFAGFAAARDHLAAADHVHIWGLFLHPVADRWHGRKIALLGDAAHPTLPFLAQGANLALEDAWTLAAALDAGDLPAWQAARRPRVVRAIGAAAANARSYHLRGPVRHVAHAGLRAVGRVAPGVLPRRFDWLYAHDVTQEPGAGAMDADLQQNR